MQLKLLAPKHSLNKAYLKEKVNRTDIELFKKEFAALLGKINEHGDEEHLKSLVADFLKFAWYKDAYQINPIGKNDLVIHTGKTPVEPIGVIIEVKSPTNRAEMISEGKPNTKAIHELILYYLQERIGNNKHDIKQLIATNIYEWYIFDANEFDKKIYRNTAIKKLYDQKIADGKDNPWFYEEIKKLLANTGIALDATFFDIRDFKKAALNSNTDDDRKLIPLYKILSPVNLLKLSFANDSNTLQPKFYSELLHIIGLYEYKEGSKKLISRKKAEERNAGSLLENAIINLDSHDKISRLDKPSQYGDTYADRLYNVALELVITWVNRILFLKLLEAQLLNYHKGDKSYNFLNKDKIKDFDDLDKLFFRVLAKRVEERSGDIMSLFGKVPYLNSSLFEPTDLEHQAIFISGLEDFIPLPVSSATILKDAKGKTLKGTLNSIDYLFEFLNAYDFSSEGAEEIQEDNKTLINASVLGLIFEKINGYKDGSFFTPGFITMYMCRETIRRAVVQKFNDAKDWEVKDYSELYDRIDNRREANTIINSLKICDPAVGSGHFLVSALNELIAIKSDLNILMAEDGRTLRDHTIEVVNDELIVTDENGDPFKYNYQDARSQAVQRTLFHEKQTLIENCLFGVDINPNSVKICRLRLWIELLKNAYYKPSAAGGVELETLPNIDINIKTGNSLISRFALDADLKQALRNTKWNINDYKIAVDAYKNATDKAAKRELVELIESIKTNFRTSISRNAKEYKELSKLRGQLDKLLGSNEDLFGVKKKNKKDLEFEQRRLEMTINEQEKIIDEIKNNKIFENAFEWRFEFPEILNDDGEFLGFDVAIGNPPYISALDMNRNHVIKDYFKKKYPEAEGSYDIYVLFLRLGIDLSKSYGQYSWIIPNKFQIADYAKKTLNMLLQNGLKSSIDISVFQVFNGVGVYPIILNGEKNSFSFYEKLTVASEEDINTNIFSKARDITAEKTFKDFGIKIMAGTTGFEAQVIKQYITTDSNQGIKFTVSGNIDRYEYNNVGVRYMNSKYDKAFIKKNKEVAESKWNFWTRPKIVVAGMTKKIESVYVEEPLGLGVGCYGIYDFGGISPIALLAILNSKYLSYYLNIKFKDKHLAGGYLAINKSTLEALPLVDISLDFQKKLSFLVEQIFLLKRQNNDTSRLEKEIDVIVYELYNLTTDEIETIEQEKAL